MSGDTATPAIEHLSAVREPHLRALADQLGLTYTRLTADPESLSTALCDQRYARRRTTPTDLYWLPAAIAVVAVDALPAGLASAQSRSVINADTFGQASQIAAIHS